MEWAPNEPDSAGGSAKRLRKDDDAQGHAGLQQVLSSVLRGVDDAHLRLGRLRRLQEQKEGLLQRGRGVLLHHCDATWERRGGSDGECQASVEAECGPAGWRVRAQLTAPAAELDGREACLAVAGGWCPVASTHQTSSRRQHGAGANTAQLELTAQLALGEFDPGAAQSWRPLHVFIVLRSGDEWRRSIYAGSLALDQLTWLQGLAAHKTVAAAALRPHAAMLTVHLHRLQLNSLEEVMQQSLACTPVASSGASQGPAGAAKQPRKYQLGCSATFTLERSGEHQAAVSIRAADCQLLRMLCARLEAALRHSLPEGSSISVAFGEQTAPPRDHADVVAAAEAALLEVDALSAWVEGLLRHSAAADAAFQAERPAPELARLAAVQEAAVEAMMRTDRAVAGLL